MPLDWEPLPKYLERTGESAEAVHKRVRSGHWLRGIHVSVPKGAKDLWVNLTAVNDWDDKTLAKVWKKAHAGTGIAYRNPYQLRHTWASNLLSQGANVAKIAKLLGHENIEITIRSYARWVDQGASLGFSPPPLRYGQSRLWAQEGTGT